MSQGGRGAKQTETDAQDIFGVSTWSNDAYRSNEFLPKKAMKIVLKKSKADTENGNLNIKTSLLKK